MNCNFAKEKWDLKDLTYAYSYRFEETTKFTQKEDCVESCADPSAPGGYDNIPLVTKEKYTYGTTIMTNCAFDSGAPEIIFVKELCTDERGVLRFGEYIEIVMYGSGVNVWQMWMNEGKVTWRKLMGVSFAVSAGEVHTFSAAVDEAKLTINVDDRKMELYVPNLYRSFHAGITACEGINRFYDLSIDGVLATE